MQVSLCQWCLLSVFLYLVSLYLMSKLKLGLSNPVPGLSNPAPGLSIPVLVCSTLYWVSMQATCCQRLRRKLAPQNVPCLTWASSATVAIGRKCCCATSTTSRARRSPSKVSWMFNPVFVHVFPDVFWGRVTGVGSEQTSLNCCGTYSCHYIYGCLSKLIARIVV